MSFSELNSVEHYIIHQLSGVNLNATVDKAAEDSSAQGVHWAYRSPEELSRGVNEVPSSAIGEMAMDRLRGLDHIAYIRFISVYQSFDDLEQLKHEVDALYADRTERAPGQTTLRLVAEDGDLTPVGPRGGSGGQGGSGGSGDSSTRPPRRK